MKLIMIDITSNKHTWISFVLFVLLLCTKPLSTLSRSCSLLPL
jgi:hypothetical protein